MPFFGKKWAFCNSFRQFLHSVPILELDVSSVPILELDVSELHTPVMKQLTKLQIYNSFLSEIDCKLLDISTVWLVQCRYTAVHVVFGSKEDFMDVTSTILHVLVNVYETLDITFMVFGSGYLILFLSCLIQFPMAPGSAVDSPQAIFTSFKLPKPSVMPVVTAGGGFAGHGLIQGHNMEHGQGSNPGTSPPSPEGSSKSSTPVSMGTNIPVLPEHKTYSFTQLKLMKDNYFLPAWMMTICSPTHFIVYRILPTAAYGVERAGSHT